MQKPCSIPNQKFEINDDIDNIIKNLSNLRAKYINEYNRIELLGEDDDDYTECYFTGFRDETLEEKKIREDKDKIYNEQRLEWRKQEYKKLKLEFEPTMKNGQQWK